MHTDLALIFLSELTGTALMVLLGGGVIANAELAKTKGASGGFLMIALGWGLAVFMGVLVSAYSGGHINPAFSTAMLVLGRIPVTQYLVRIAAQFLGAFLGAVLCWGVYRRNFDLEPDPARKLGVFATVPAVRGRLGSLLAEVAGTFVLVFVVLSFADHGDQTAKIPGDLGVVPALAVAFVVTGIVASLGGPTGAALNPARDLAPRIAHALLPIRGKGSSDWGYAWVPVVGPLVGGLLAAGASTLLLGLG